MGAALELLAEQVSQQIQKVAMRLKGTGDLYYLS
jgi:hypothetical protein